MSDHGIETNNVTELINKLCLYFANDKSENASSLFQIAIRSLPGLTISSIVTPNDEFLISERIKTQLLKTNCQGSIPDFEKLLLKLDRLNILKNKANVLAFLHHYSTSPSLSSLDFSTDLRKSSISTSQSKGQSSSSVNTYGVESTIERIYPISDNKTTFTSNSSTQIPHSQGQVSSQTLEIFQKQSLSSFNSKSSSSLCDIPEQSLIQELIYAFQGIEGRVLKHEPSGGFRIDSKAAISRSHRRFVLRLSEVGYLHNQVRQFCELADKELGIIAQSFVSALRDELTEYYRLVATLQERLNTGSELTLRRLTVWVLEPQDRLKWLVTITQAVQDQKGGALISTVFSYLQHGSPSVKCLVRYLLNAVCKPMLTTMSRWVLDGQLDDPWNEFFIEARPDVSGDRLWHDKYRVRRSMLPSFITAEQAEKIIATGKSIDFLRVVCQEQAPVIKTNLKQMFDEHNVEALYTGNQSSALHAAIESTYKENSRCVLDIMTKKYQLMNHLQAMKRYMLLGQGDFIRQLMELLTPELSLPANQLLPHNLSAILESTIRATNARYEDSDVLARLDVRTLQISAGDTGWEVFTLCYHCNGPIGTIFEPCYDLYFNLFGCLWNVKRMEFILSTSWKNLTTSAKLFRSIPGMAPIMKQMHLLTSDMIHLIQQLQYYLQFEVLECQWAEFMHQVSTAENIDDIIRFHKQFLRAACAGALLDRTSEDLGKQLRNVYSHVIKLQTFEERLCNQALAELNAEREYERHIEENRGYGTNARDQALRKERQTRFQQVLVAGNGHLRTIAQTYQKNVRKFLTMLALHSDVSLQHLSVRLDFNNHYKRLARRLVSSTSKTSVLCK